MSKFIIEGGRPLRGTVRVGGAKNAGFKLMIAACLAKQESRLLNLSSISDVEVTSLTLKQLGISIKDCGERSVFIRPNGIKDIKLPQFAGKKTRASTIFAGMLLANKKAAVIPLPGGCILGKRPVDRHLQALMSLGVKIKQQGRYYHLSTKGLKGTTFRFPKKTHTGTEAMLLAAVKAKGRTVIENAGQEPEIDDLIAFLIKMGAQIKRTANDRIIIDGVKCLKGATHRIMPDRNEAVSYAVAALSTKGDVVLENAIPAHLSAFLKKLEAVGAKFEISHFGIRFWYEKRLQAVDIATAPAPGFMTDWQPLWTVLMTQAQGTSRIIERVHNNRFQFADQLKLMGAKISLFNPVVKNPDSYYEFAWPEEDGHYHAAKVVGPTTLTGASLQVTDLRAGATLVVAALAAAGRSTLSNIEHIERGYEKLDEKLRKLGAKIRRVES